MILGFDFLALAHPRWPLDATIKYTPKGFGIGCFDNVFGNALPAIKKVCASGKFPMVRVHLQYTSGAQKPLASLALVQDRARRYEAIALAYPGTKIYLSHTCEYTDQEQEHVALRDAVINKIAPHCFAVDSINNCMNGTGLEEIHTDNTDPKYFTALPYSISTDGFDFAKIDPKKFKTCHAKAVYALAWYPAFNLKKSISDNTPIEKRTAIPSVSQLRSLINRLR